MTTVLDVAKYILSKQGDMTAMKLQKLVYYSQAWHLVWDEEELFPERIEAWANGPVAPDLYRAHRGAFRVSAVNFPGDADVLQPNEKGTVDGVLEFYAGRSAAELSDLTHLEEPWRLARGDAAPHARSTHEITRAMMAEYYGAL